MNETYRLLKEDGRVLLTMINPVVGFFAHKFIWWGEHRKRGMGSEEELGMERKEIENYFSSNFVLEDVVCFFYLLNNLYVFRKKT